MGYNPQESLQNTINTMGTLLGVHWYTQLSLEFKIASLPNATKSGFHQLILGKPVGGFNPIEKY